MFVLKTRVTLPQYLTAGDESYKRRWAHRVISCDDTERNDFSEPAYPGAGSRCGGRLAGKGRTAVELFAVHCSRLSTLF